ncbi:VOC family protein [Micropruina sonneratiae]|uniref:VOC family protein n=1 Tax=Micropruina sonneratiae TaxID=2986940 RepID=UPI002226A667|nr:VOC family protein [Micropruina sp. KQZ13P-5]MCW3157798.1 hypothetical protein [Micropruina sp. KQZ13P-5]
MANNVFPILRTTDVARLAAYYRDAVGATVHYRFEDAYVGLTVGSGSLGVTRVDAATPGDNVLLWCYVDDVDAAHAAALAAGGTQVSAPADMPWGNGWPRSAIRTATWSRSAPRRVDRPPAPVQPDPVLRGCHKVFRSAGFLNRPVVRFLVHPQESRGHQSLCEPICLGIWISVPSYGR